MKRTAALTLFLLCAAPAAGAAETAPAACAAPEYRQLDFWIGDWEVYDGAGKLQGRNRVEKVYGGCVIQENWSGTEGDSGSSFNIYDASRKVWNETWVSNHGYFLSIEGGLHGKDLVLVGSHIGGDGKPELHRGIWTPTDYGVHQVWEYSVDGGRSWITRFEGILRRAKTAG